MTNPPAETRSLVIEKEMPHPPSKVWRALTEGQLIEQWLMANDFQPVVGHRFSFRSMPVQNWNGIIDSEVLVLEPITRLAYRWSSLGLESVVTWTLTPTEGGTHPRMEQTGFGPGQDAAYKGATYGWRSFIGKLELVLEHTGGGGGVIMKARSIVYWTMTILIAFLMGSGGVAQIVQFVSNPHGEVPLLGYPLYFFAILGFWKALGAIAILVPGFPRLKEWAYAGIFFDLTGAAASCTAVGGYGAYGFHVLAPLILAGFTVASWALRPESRKIGILIPAKRSEAA